MLLLKKKLEMQKINSIIVLFFLLIFISCKNESKDPSRTFPEGNIIEILYAEGFQITDYGDYKILTVTNPWPNAQKAYKYALVQKEKELPFEIKAKVDAVINIPVEKMIVTSTTHIPSLEMLGVSDKLIAFPNLNYISSEVIRKHIADNKIKEIGNNESINTEVVIDVQPDVMIGFAVTGNNKTYITLEQAGIPIAYNGDWTETSPLGKAEWLKFFGAFFNKDAEAEKLFSEIETEYNKTKVLAHTAASSPTAFSGALWKDIWYLPEGNSWGAKFIADANGSYLWADSQGTGSLALNVETVLDRAQHADFWIGPGQFTTYSQLQETNKVYTQFDVFKNKKIYSFSSLKGETGGIVYYELAPNRPDLVLKDLVKIMHPELLPDYELYFFRALD